jgi:uncharacterized 2Fe-2S/4Fe-4S cluster protein (DUF4445 family)
MRFVLVKSAEQKPALALDQAQSAGEAVYADCETAAGGRNSGGNCLELFRQRRGRIESEATLRFSHHLNHHPAGQRDPCGRTGL